MRKITGKALATVLAMALLTSSFSGTFAFAATTEKAGSIGFNGDDEITLVKNSNSTLKYDLNDLILGVKMDTVDKEFTDTPNDEDGLTFRHAKGDTLLSIDKDGKARVKTDKTGTETIMVYAEATIQRDDKDVTLKGQKEITVNVVESGKMFVATGKPEEGKKIPSLEMAYNDIAPKAVNIYRAISSEDLKANYELVTPDKEIDGKIYRIEATGNTNVGVDYVKEGEKDTAAVSSITNKGVNTGTLKLSIKSAKPVTTGTPNFNSTEETTTATVLKRIDVRGDVKIAKTSGSSYATGDGVAQVKDEWKDLSKKNVSGYDIKVTSDAAATKDNTILIDVDESVSIGKVTSDVDQKAQKPVVVTLTAGDKAKVGDIEDINTVTVMNATVGAVDIYGDFTIDEGRATSVEADDTVYVNGGTVSGNVKAATVNVDNLDEDIDTNINGTVEATNVTVKNSNGDGKIKIATVSLNTDANMEISDTNITIDKINGNYKGNVSFKDFQGKIASLVNVDQVSVDSDTVAVIEAAADIDSLNIDEDGSFEFKDAANLVSLSGDGKLIIPADKLYVSDDVSGEIKLRLAGANVSVGDVAFKAGKDNASTDSLVGVGYTLEKKSVDKNTDSFLVKSTSFAGVALDKSEVSIAKNFSDTVTVANYPASTALPSGASIVWDFSDADKDIFDITAEGASVKIAVKDFDEVYATSNNFELTATVVDKDGDALEDYDQATCNVTAIKEVPVSSDLSGIVEVPQGSTKDFVVNSSVDAPVTVGTAGVAVHAVKTAFADAKATYSIKATGEVGTTAGVYATVPGQNAIKLFVIKVTAPVVTSDTTVDFSLTAGSRYVFKITAPSAPAFTVGNGNVLKTQAGKIVGNDYYFSVYAAGTAGTSTGVYVNGVKICTVTVK